MPEDRHLVEQNFIELDHRLRHHGAGIGLAEIDGMACGMLAGGRGAVTGDDWRALLGEASDDAGIQSVVAVIAALANRSLGSGGFEFSPLLPDEETDPALRIEAVADWCSGFLQGLRRVSDATPAGAAGEAIDDILSLCELTPDDRPAERQQRDLAEVIEYLRVAVQLVHEEFKSRPADPDRKPRR